MISTCVLPPKMLAVTSIPCTMMSGLSQPMSWLQIFLLHKLISVWSHAFVAKDSDCTAKSLQLALAGAEGNSSKGSEETSVKDDIAARKKDAQEWITEWRQETGGK